MNTLDASYITEQNKISSSGAWIWLLEIAITDDITLRYANDNSNKVWPSVGGNTYSKMPIAMDDVSVSTSGEFPTYTLQIGDVDLDGGLRTYVYSLGGLVGYTVRLRVVHSAHLDLTTPAIDEMMEILNCEVTAGAIVFTVGLPSLLSKRFPRDKYLPAFCRHKFGGALCRYVQPSYSYTGTDISFVAGIDYNQINVASGWLITNVFPYVDGDHGLPTPIYPYTPGAQLLLDDDTSFVITNSASNDGWFIAKASEVITQTRVRVFTESDKGRTFVEESAGAEITIQLGYNACDHTLEACKLRNSSQNYGGSPGIAGGMYG